MGNLIVGQSGGPTSVINSSLAGVFKQASILGIEKIYGMRNGIQGLLQKNVVDLSDKITSDLDIELLKRTPASFLGSCRYKLPNITDKPEIYEKIFNILTELNVEYFLYIGGNDSMDTISKLSAYFKETNKNIKCIGVPKTIDNDLAVTDHTPGFGSAAKYIATTLKEIIRDCSVYEQKSVTLVEIMGRNSGWLTASSLLSKSSGCPAPDIILLPETATDIDKLIQRISFLHKTKSSLVIALSEGIRLSDGRYICELSNNNENTDAFGHKMLSGAAKFLSDKIAVELSCKTRAIELNILQRCSSHIVSGIDIQEAFEAGSYGVKAAFEDNTGKMVTINRINNNPYKYEMNLFDITKIANLEKTVPLEWIDTENMTVKEAFIVYAKPLIQQELYPIMVDGLPVHLVL